MKIKQEFFKWQKVQIYEAIKQKNPNKLRKQNPKKLTSKPINETNFKDANW